MRQRSELWPAGLVGAMFAASAIAMPRLPDTVPTRWWGGVATSVAPSSTAVWVLPVIGLGFYGGLWLASRRHGGDAAALPWLLRVIIAGTFLILQLALLAAFAGYRLSVAVPLGLIVALLGSLLGSVPPNGLIGVRTKWSLASRRSWARSNRLGARLFVLVGAAGIVAGVLGVPRADALFLVSLFAIAVVLARYSYVEWRKDPDARPV
jgi:uncharacterized membrane protein